MKRIEDPIEQALLAFIQLYEVNDRVMTTDLLNEGRKTILSSLYDLSGKR